MGLLVVRHVFDDLSAEGSARKSLTQIREGKIADYADKGGPGGVKKSALRQPMDTVKRVFIGSQPIGRMPGILAMGAWLRASVASGVLVQKRMGLAVVRRVVDGLSAARSARKSLTQIREGEIADYADKGAPAGVTN